MNSGVSAASGPSWQATLAYGLFGAGSQSVSLSGRPK
jgi:hypothetical protein